MRLTGSIPCGGCRSRRLRKSWCKKRQVSYDVGSHNVVKFKFALPKFKFTSVLGLAIGQCISCRGKDATGEEVIKPYTPATLDSDIGYVELVIKVTYRKHVPTSLHVSYRWF